MSLAELAGRTFAPTEPFPVTTERIAEFARALGVDYDHGPAPVTFPIVVAFAAIRDLVEDPESGLSLAGLVHGEQRFSYRRPVLPGDHLSAQLSVESVRSMAAATWLRTRSEIHDHRGEQVLTAWASLIHRQPVTDAAVPGERLPTPRGGER